MFSKTRKAIAAVFLGLIIAVVGVSAASAAGADDPVDPDRLCKDEHCED
ncbi:hypothetical protein [Glycomyces sp. NPDC047010]